MADTTAVVDKTTSAAVNKAAKAAAVTAAEVSSVLPQVVETAEVAMEIPAKVVLNQKLIVVVSILGGAALGAGALYGVNWFRNRKKTVVVVDDAEIEKAETSV